MMAQEIAVENRLQDTAHSREDSGREKPSTAKPAKNIRKGRKEKPLS
jgi:hypothetical protein